MIGSNLKKLRKIKGYSINQLCEMLDLNINTYPKYERNERNVSTEMLIKFAEFYGVSTDYILGIKPGFPLDMLPLSDQEMSAMELYVTLPENHRKIFIDTMVKLAEAISETRKEETATEELETATV